MSNIKYFLFAILLIAFLPACKSSKKTASAGKTNDITKFKNLGVTDNTKEVIEPQYMEDRNGNLVVTSLYGLTIYKENFCEETMIKEIDNT